MKKLLLLIPLVILLCFTNNCQKLEEVERYMEDGVEVVVNHVEPYKIKGIPSTLQLVELFTIDTERDEIADFGLNDIWGFDVSSTGEIFIFKPPMSEGNFIFKFNKLGEFIKSFGDKGQGPGEVQFPFYQKISFRDEISVVCAVSYKYLVYDKDGNLLSEIKLEPNLSTPTLLLNLINGNYVYRKYGPSESESYSNLILSIIDSTFEEIKELGRISMANAMVVPQLKLPPLVFTTGVSKTNIFVGIEDRGYDIHVYDFEGQLIRIIRKEYTPVPFSKESKEQIMKRFESVPFKDKIVTPRHNPPFKHLFTDDLGKLYVVTFEPGNNQGEYKTDVFDAGGVFYCQLSLKLFLNAEISPSNRPWDDSVTIKNDTLYCIQEKESGFKELVVYKMTWE